MTEGAKPEGPDAATAVSVFKAVADPRRVRVLRVLLEVPDTLCGCEIADVLDLADYQVSRAVTSLRRAGLVEERARTGTWIHYAAARGVDPTIDRVLEVVGTMALSQVETDRLALRYGLREQAGCVLGAQHPLVLATFEAGGLIGTIQPLASEVEPQDPASSLGGT